MENNQTHKTWDQYGRNWLEQEASKEFQAWLQSKKGQAWKKSAKSKSPYQMGFSLPDWHHQAMAFLNKGLEEEFKALMLGIKTYTFVGSF